jgi:hypothetical protein
MPAPTRLVTLEPDQITRRITEYVNTHFAGNLTTATRAMGCSYYQLRNAIRGAQLSTTLLAQLARHSGRSADWWLTGKED